MFGMFFLGSLYLRRVLGYSPLQIGLAFLPVTIVMGALSVRYTDRLAVRFGARATLVRRARPDRRRRSLLFAQAPVRGGYVDSRSAGHAADRRRRRAGLPGADDGRDGRGHAAADAGLASGLVNTTAQVGGALGLAVLATVSAAPHQHARGPRGKASPPP